MVYRIKPSGAIVSVLLVLMAVRCTPTFGDEPTVLIGVDESKAMILDFLNNSKTAKTNAWIAASKAIISKHDVRVLKDGTIAWGPWSVKPASRRVQLVADLSYLEGEVVQHKDAWKLEKVEIYTIRRRVDKERGPE